MAEPQVDIYFDASDYRQKVAFYAQVTPLRGMMHAVITPSRPTRSTRQNRAYFATVVAPFWQYLNGQEHTVVSRDTCHRILKKRCLGTIEICDPNTGEVLTEEPKSTTDLSVEEFSVYMEKARAYLAEMFLIATADPDPFWRDVKSEPATARKEVARG